MHRLPRIVACLACCTALLAFTADRALAQSDLQAGSSAYWAITGAEVGMGATFGILMAAGVPSDLAPGLSVVGGLAGLVTAALLGKHDRLDARPALAIHGGLWLGSLGAAVGSLLDGEGDPERTFAFGPWTVALGLAGAALGATWGALAIDSTNGANAWYVSPVYAAVMSLVGYFVLAGWRRGHGPERDWGAVLVGAGFAFALSLVASSVAEPQSYR